MYQISYNSKVYNCRQDETALEALLRQGAGVDFSCRKGSCYVCMMHCESGEVTEESQKNIKPIYKTKNYVLPCQFRPVSDISIAKIKKSELFTTGVVVSKEYFTDSVCKLLIEIEDPSGFYPGQFINLARPSDGVARSYSIANIPEDDYFIELHIKRMANGELSNWVFDSLMCGNLVDIQGPLGNSYYQNNVDSPILLVATNTGLAPAIGVLRDAFKHQHTADIHLFHASQNDTGLYLHNYLKELDAAQSNFTYHACVQEETDTGNVSLSYLVENIKNVITDLSNWNIYLSGSEAMVNRVTETVLFCSASPENIYSDCFDLKDLRHNEGLESGYIGRRKTDMPQADDKQTEAGYPPTDMGIWESLDSGCRLTSILNDFYTIVYADERLAPFFRNVTQQRSIEKAYLFLKQLFTGEKVYFGDRPRNAHHWMVISNDLFDYREKIMESCLRKNGLPEALIQRWLEKEEYFRSEIVKDVPWNKVVDGVEQPVDGYEELELDTGTICDICHQEVSTGTIVRYHVRLGEVYCPECMRS